MKIPPRRLSAQEAEYLARTCLTRTAVKGRIECFGLSYKSDALLEWEVRQRTMNLEPKVEVRVDELDLGHVYVASLDGSAGPFKAVSRQPHFTAGLSIYELNRLKALLKDKALADRLGRLEDDAAMRLRIEFHKGIGHGDDPVALKRLSSLQNEMARLRLTYIDNAQEPFPPPAKAELPRKSKSGATKAVKAKQSPSSRPAATDIPARASPDTHASKRGTFPTPKFQAIQLNRRTV